MRYGEIPGVGKRISRLVQGTMALHHRGDDEENFAILDASRAAGIDAFDTAQVYGAGRCDAILGRWMEARGNREEVVILAKGCHHNDARKRVTPFDMAADIHDSLARLRTGYIDLWMFHRDDPAVPVGPLVEAANEHLAAGRIRAYGGSNWSPARLQEANEYAAAHGLAGFAASSPNFSLAEQLESPWGDDCLTISGPAHEADRRWYAEHAMPVFAWSSLARGFLSGRLTRDNLEEQRGRIEEHVIRCYVSEDNWRRQERAAELAAAKGLSLPQIALAYVLSQPFESYALVASCTGEEARANAAAVECRLTPEEIAWLELRSDAAPVG